MSHSSLAPIQNTQCNTFLQTRILPSIWLRLDRESSIADWQAITHLLQSSSWHLQHPSQSMFPPGLSSRASQSDNMYADSRNRTWSAADVPTLNKRRSLKDLFGSCSNSGSFNDSLPPPPYSFADLQPGRSASLPDLATDAKAAREQKRMEEFRRQQRIAKTQMLDARIDRALLKMGL